MIFDCYFLAMLSMRVVTSNQDPWGSPGVWRQPHQGIQTKSWPRLKRFYYYPRLFIGLIRFFIQNKFGKKALHPEILTLVLISCFKVLDANSCDYQQREKFLLLCSHGDSSSDFNVQVQRNPRGGDILTLKIISNFGIPVGDWSLQTASTIPEWGQIQTHLWYVNRVQGDRLENCQRVEIITWGGRECVSGRPKRRIHAGMRNPDVKNQSTYIYQFHTDQKKGQLAIFIVPIN